MPSTAYKTTLPIILRCHGNVFTKLLSSNDIGINRQTHRHDTNATENDKSNNVGIVESVFVAVATFSQSCCLVTYTKTDGRDL
jgi:hypothetical protein